MTEPQPLPSAVMAEKYLLSCMMDNPETNVRRAFGEGLTGEMFFHHRHLYDELTGYFRSHKSFDLGPFIQSLQIAGALDRVGGHGEIVGIFTYACGSSAQWPAYVTQLRETYAIRLAILQSVRLGEAGDSGDAIGQAESLLLALRDAVKGPRRSVGGKVAMDEFLARLSASYEAGEIPGESTGIPPIDGISGGMKPGELWIIGGKPSRGKSVLLLQIACEFLQRDKPVAIFSLEMMRHVVAARLLSTLGRINYGVLTQPRKATKGDMQHIRTWTAMLAKSPLWIDDTANQNVESILGEATRLRDMTGKLSLVVVDYLQLIRGNRQKNESREEEVARVSGSLKQLAKELHCPVISATQLNEAGQSRESRAIEQDADALFIIVEDGIKVVKLRDGVRNDLLPLYLHGAIQRFQEGKPIETNNDNHE